MQRPPGVFAAERVLDAKTAPSLCLGGMTVGLGDALTEALLHHIRDVRLVNRDLAE